MPVKLFCGGPCNGKEINVDRRYWIVAIMSDYMRSIKLTDPDEYDATKATCESHYYEADVFCGREVMIYRGPW